MIRVRVEKSALTRVVWSAYGRLSDLFLLDVDRDDLGAGIRLLMGFKVFVGLLGTLKVDVMTEKV